MGISGIVIKLEDFSVVTQRRMATESTTELLLNSLAKSEDVETRRNVAANVNCSSGVIQLLMKENDWLTRYNLAKNPAVSTEKLWEIYSDCEKRIQQINETAHASTKLDLRAAEINVLDGIVINSKNATDDLIQKVQNLISKN